MRQGLRRRGMEEEPEMPTMWSGTSYRRRSAQITAAGQLTNRVIGDNHVGRGQRSAHDFRPDMDFFPLARHVMTNAMEDRIQAPFRSPSTCVSPSDMQRRSEEHTSELQSLTKLVCRLLLEK